MNNLPKDPMMLFSFVNTKLRDDYKSLDDFCSDLDVEKEILIKTLGDAGFVYEPSLNKFW